MWDWYYIIGSFHQKTYFSNNLVDITWLSDARFLTYKIEGRGFQNACVNQVRTYMHHDNIKRWIGSCAWSFMKNLCALWQSCHEDLTFSATIMRSPQQSCILCNNHAFSARIMPQRTYVLDNVFLINWKQTSVTSNRTASTGQTPATHDV